MSDQQAVAKRLSKSSWALVAFYVLIGFEFLYMASPFAVYFYGVYGPGLRFFEQVPAFAFLTRFFMPHIVKETSSPVLDLHNPVGTLLAITGGLGFCLAAGQVYYRKLAKRGAATGGAYRFIRHPQYLSLLLCGCGLLLLWPRYVALVMFITMIFAYYCLARIEERECEAKFGAEYLRYKSQTSMFIPLPSGFRERLPAADCQRTRAVLTMVLLYTGSLAAAIGAAKAVERHSVRSLYSLHDGQTEYISASRIDSARLRQVANVVRSDDRVSAVIGDQGDGHKLCLAYVLPTNWFVSEVPMYLPDGNGYETPSAYEPDRYKVVYTRLVLRPEQGVNEELISRVQSREPLFEVTVDLQQGRVVSWHDPNLGGRYSRIPMAIY